MTDKKSLMPRRARRAPNWRPIDTRWPRRAESELAADMRELRESVAGRIEAEEDRIRRLTPGDDSWESPEFRAGMLHAAAIVRADQ